MREAEPQTSRRHHRTTSKYVVRGALMQRREAQAPATEQQNAFFLAAGIMGKIKQVKDTW